MRRKPTGTHSEGGDETGLQRLIELATVDCYSDEEAIGAWATVLAEKLEVPFETQVLGVEVEVAEIRERGHSGLVFRCRGRGSTQDIDVLDLPMPKPPPRGVLWVYAYRRWKVQR